MRAHTQLTMEPEMRTLTTLLCLLLLTACSPAVSIDTSDTFAPVTPEQPILVMPVASIMCPEDVSEAFFDRLITHLNRLGSPSGYSFLILKQDPESLPPETLAMRTYATGEIYGCLEETGCCSGEVLMTMRLELFQPGQSEPTLRMRYPAEKFFDLEAATPKQARTDLASQTAEQVAEDLIEALKKTN